MTPQTRRRGPARGTAGREMSPQRLPGAPRASTRPLRRSAAPKLVAEESHGGQTGETRNRGGSRQSGRKGFRQQKPPRARTRRRYPSPISHQSPGQGHLRRDQGPGDTNEISPGTRPGRAERRQQQASSRATPSRPGAPPENARENHAHPQY